VLYDFSCYTTIYAIYDIMLYPYLSEPNPALNSISVFNSLFEWAIGEPDLDSSRFRSDDGYSQW
jgi:hypothetical protein